MWVGYGGPGVVAVRAGADAQVDSFSVGEHALSDGCRLVVTGPGTTLDCAGDGDVGGGATGVGRGEMRITDGAVVDVDGQLKIWRYGSLLLDGASLSVGSLAGEFNPGAMTFASGMLWIDGDFTGDGEVSVFDLAALANNYGASGGQPIPEPATLTLLIPGVLSVARRRRA